MELDSSCQTEVLELEGKTDVAGVFFQYSDMRKILENYGHMIFVDVTYSVNLEKYHLLTFLVADGENHGQPVGYAYICNESQPVLDLCFGAFRKSLKLSNREKVDIFMVDKDMKSIRSLQKALRPKGCGLSYTAFRSRPAVKPAPTQPMQCRYGAISPAPRARRNCWSSCPAWHLSMC